MLALNKNELVIAGPGGNYTAFVNGEKSSFDYIKLDKRIRKNDKRVEQVCFYIKKDGIWNAEMSGGEFCGSAAMAFSYLVSITEKNNKPAFYFSGCKNFILTEVLENKVEAMLFSVDIKKCFRRLSEKKFLVSLPGIYHVISQNTLNQHNIYDQLGKVLRENNVKNPPAAGYIISDNQSPISINPYVWVPKVDSFINETACISGSIAVAIERFFATGLDEHVIRQPSGSFCQINLKKSPQENNFDVYVKLKIDIIN